MNNWLVRQIHFKYAYLAIIALLYFNCTGGYAQLDNSNGIDLTNISFENTNEVNLNSGWEFYWKQLITPNNFAEYTPQKIDQLHSWTNFKGKNGEKLPSFGYATYRLNLSISTKNTSNLSLYFPAAYASSKLWINGKFISEIGKVGKTKKEVLHRRFNQIIPLNTHETNFEIIIQVANFYHSKAGLDKTLKIGTSQHFNTVKSKRIVADMIFIGCLGFIGTFFIVFFLLYWNKDKAILYLGIACIGLAYMALSDRYAPFAQILDKLSWVLLTKIEYSSLFLAGTCASLFFSVIFERYVHKFYEYILKYSCLLLSILVIILPSPYFTKLIVPFLILMIINLIYVTYVIIRAMITGKLHDSILMLASTLLGSIVFYIHIFIFLGKNDNAIVYVNFGYVSVFLLLSMLLMVRFSSSFKQLETSTKLAVKQKNEITEKSNQLTEINQELKENLRQLESFNAELDSFNHIVSHDLKAPLVAMHSLVTFIEEDLESDLDDNAKNYFDLLKGRISKMNALINGLLEYSKVARGSKEKEIFSFNELLQEIIAIVNYKSDSIINIPDEDTTIHCSRIELEHVIQNLVSNSIKYNDKQKAIIDITVAKYQDEYLFSVSDNGPGIAPQYHQKIFEIFSKLDTNDEIESTGVGLSIVKKLVSENHGTITVESDLGKGTKINFTWKRED
ncbi:sensor histidine kinase [Tenacibaculum jejuense]|uniref:histidine kinase n=1 Tax=Tenacibaculum jejuense TaxID=584609 RepID=A0A238U992_9FLAO|nr:sensor histidine kinase [Tenacibaculum jejuense]SNR15759.1 integral membrane sensor histidine kinase [Tenacibaculum jejuense]